MRPVAGQAPSRRCPVKLKGKSKVHQQVCTGIGENGWWKQRQWGALDGCGDDGGVSSSRGFVEPRTKATPTIGPPRPISASTCTFVACCVPDIRSLIYQNARGRRGMHCKNMKEVAAYSKTPCCPRAPLSSECTSKNSMYRKAQCYKMRGRESPCESKLSHHEEGVANHYLQ